MILTILNLILKLFGLGDKAAEAARRREEHNIGRTLQQADDLAAANAQLKAQAKAAQDAPTTREALEDRLSKGDI